MPASLRGQAARADNARWQVRGMKGTMSGTLDFTGLCVAAHERIGAPGDSLENPLHLAFEDVRHELIAALDRRADQRTPKA